MYKKCFSPQSEQHTAKLYLSVVLKHFWSNSLRTFFLNIKVTKSETSTEILRKFVFLTMFERDKILRKIRICLKIFF